MEKSSIKRKEKFKRLQNILEELDININNQTLIQDNKILFQVEDHLYRCRMPNQQERFYADQKKNQLYLDLIQQPKTVTKKQLIKILKEHQNIDIDKLEHEKLTLSQKIKELYLDLVPYSDNEKKNIDSKKEKVEEIEKELMRLSLEISTYLGPCIESQVDACYIEYLTYLCTEKLKKEDQWISTWKTFEDFQNAERKLLNKSIESLTNLILNF